jgi:hypothetical protein
MRAKAEPSLELVLSEELGIFSIKLSREPTEWVSQVWGK